MTARPFDRPEVQDEAARLNTALSWLLETSASLLPSRSLEATVSRYLALLLDWLGAEQGSVMLRQGDELVIAACRGLSQEVSPGMRVRLHDSVAAGAVTEGTPRVLRGRLRTRRVHARPASAMIIPLRIGDRVAGVLNIGKLSGARQFTTEDLQSTSILALQLAWLLANFELMSERSQSPPSTSSPNGETPSLPAAFGDGPGQPGEGKEEIGRALTDLAERIDEAVEVLRRLVGLTNPQAPVESLRLTPRELEMLTYLAEGKSNGEIAKRCWISENTVKFHLKNLFKKLNVRDRGQAMMLARALHGSPAAGSAATRAAASPSPAIIPQAQARTTAG
ncbi:MAG: LuxR C-terminal-related transcriptional regulator [Armatimonadota bacterium]|nr:LuxR C-terminal-related transcriptional regulator [Armatimonadota bacterium]